MYLFCLDFGVCFGIVIVVIVGIVEGVVVQGDDLWVLGLVIIGLFQVSF